MSQKVQVQGVQKNSSTGRPQKFRCRYFQKIPLQGVLKNWGTGYPRVSPPKNQLQVVPWKSQKIWVKGVQKNPPVQGFQKKLLYSVSKSSGAGCPKKLLYRVSQKNLVQGVPKILGTGYAKNWGTGYPKNLGKLVNRASRQIWAQGVPKN